MDWLEPAKSWIKQSFVLNWVTDRKSFGTVAGWIAFRLPGTRSGTCALFFERQNGVQICFQRTYPEFPAGFFRTGWAVSYLH